MSNVNRLIMRMERTSETEPAYQQVVLASDYDSVTLELTLAVASRDEALAKIKRLYMEVENTEKRVQTMHRREDRLKETIAQLTKERDEANKIADDLTDRLLEAQELASFRKYHWDATDKRVAKVTADRDALLAALRAIQLAATKGDETTTELECHNLAEEAILAHSAAWGG